MREEEQGRLFWSFEPIMQIGSSVKGRGVEGLFLGEKEMCIFGQRGKLKNRILWEDTLLERKRRRGRGKEGEHKVMLIREGRGLGERGALVWKHVRGKTLLKVDHKDK